MKNKIILGLITSIIVTGCASEPKDMVNEYVNAWANHDIEKIKALSDKKSADLLEQAISACTKTTLNKDTDQAKKEIFKNNEELRGLFRNFLDVLEENLVYHSNDKIRKFWSTMGNPDQSQYASMSDEELKPTLKKITDEALEESLNTFAYKEDFIALIVDTWIIKIRDTYPNSQRKQQVLVEKFINDIAAKSNQNGESGAKETCINTIITIDGYKSLNVIDVQELSADEQSIKIETVMQDGSTDKSYLTFELVNKEWKVINSLFLNKALPNSEKRYY